MMLCFYSLIIPLVSVYSKQVFYDLVITEELISPDNLPPMPSVLINKQFPGPEIRVNMNDILLINVTNYLNEDFSLHFHGINNNNQNDGVNYITQKPIKPKESRLYEVNTNNPGTYYYRASTRFHSVTAFGALIISFDSLEQLFDFNAKYKYKEDRLILLSDLFDRDYKQLLLETIGNDFEPAHSPRSVLINGQTYSNNTNRNDTRPSTGKHNLGNYVLNVDPDTSYLLRIICASTVSFYKFSIPNHTFTIIEVDGFYIQPIEVDYVRIHAGQRYSVILNTNQQKVNNYIGHATIIGRPDPLNGNFIVHYNGADYIDDLVLKYITPPDLTSGYDLQLIEDDWIYRNLSVSEFYLTKDSFNKNVYKVPSTVSKRFFIGMHSVYVNNSIKYNINNIVFNHEPEGLLPIVNVTETNSGVSLIDDIVYSTPFQTSLNNLYSKNNRYNNNRVFPGVYFINKNDNIELILENYIGRDGQCFEHSWHLNGHHFYVVDYGSGRYTSERFKPNLVNPVFRDTSVVQRSPNKGIYKDACGWQVLRFKAINKGVWLFGDTVTFLRLMGLQLAFVYLPKSESLPNSGINNHKEDQTNIDQENDND